MYQVNLLPWRAQRLRQRGQRYLALLALVSCTLLLLTGLCLSRWQGIRLAEQAELALLAQRHAKASETYRQALQVQEQRERLRERYRIWQLLQLRNQRYLAVFRQLPQMIPDSVWLTSLREQSRALELRGVSRDHAASAAFINALAGSGEFGSVQLTESQLHQDRNYRFTLLAEWPRREGSRD